MVLADLPDEPWQKVGTDLFQLEGKTYLLIIDYLSNYPEIALLSNASAACVIKHMKAVFARHGIPQIVYSDNGPLQFSPTKEGRYWSVKITESTKEAVRKIVMKFYLFMLHMF